MSDEDFGRHRQIRRGAGLAGPIAAALLAGACAQMGDLSLITGSPAIPDQNATAPKDARSELDKAIEYWGKEYAKNPRDLKAALSYARNLKAGGQKAQAFAVVQQVAVFNGEDRELASEYGRLALDLGQVQVAQKVLAAADDPAKPDWRVVSARGTALAKQGKCADAIPFYERALALAPEQPSVLSNLALAYAAEGQPARAEPLLRRAAETKGADPRVQQNLALVLALQGKYDEAKEVGGRELSPELAAADTDYIRQIVRLEPQKISAQAPAVAASGGSWTTTLAQGQ